MDEMEEIRIRIEKLENELHRRAKLIAEILSILNEGGDEVEPV